ncbi:magnesium transporter CorA family protein [bacterium]|nr:magnesium transporter CorA family protein [bacterium]
MRTFIKGPKVIWIDIQNPTEKDIEYLKEKFHFHPLVLEELTISAHRPKVEQYDDYLFMIIHYPVYSIKKRETKSREINIIVTRNTLITTHFSSVLPLENLLNICKQSQKARRSYMEGNAGQLLFYILNSLWHSCLVKLEKIDNRIDEIEKNIFKGREKEMVLEISLVKTDIINFWRIIEPQEEILESLEKVGPIFFGKALRPYFSDLLGTYDQTKNTLQSYKEIILALEDTNQSLLSTKINEVMKILTIFSVVLLPLTLIASIWGMNINLPLSKSPYAFWLLTGTMMVLVGILIAFFYKKKWL